MRLHGSIQTHWVCRTQSDVCCNTGCRWASKASSVFIFQICHIEIYSFQLQKIIGWQRIPAFAHVTNLPQRRVFETGCVPGPASSMSIRILLFLEVWLRTALNEKGLSPLPKKWTALPWQLFATTFLLGTEPLVGSVWLIPSLHTGFTWAVSSWICKHFHHNLSPYDLEYSVQLNI